MNVMLGLERIVIKFTNKLSIILNMIGIEKNLRHLSDEDIEIIALRWAKEKYYLTNRNVCCFIAGLEMARNWLVDNLCLFLQEEGLSMMNEYARNRINALSKSGTPLTPGHYTEFESAKQVGELLIEASRLMKENKVL